MRKQCNYCGIELDYLLPFKCKHCDRLYCKDHYLPENHHCHNLPRGNTLIKNPSRPLIYPAKRDILVPVTRINIYEKVHVRNDDNVRHNDNVRYKDSLNSYKYKLKRLSMNMVKNKWFWIIGMPIILLTILYASMWMSYGKDIADLTLLIVFFFVVFIIVLIFMPKGRRYDPLREAIYEEERIREQARIDVRKGRRRW